MKIISKNEAIAQGLMFYFTGKPCLNGHISPRYINKSSCVECNRNKGNAYYAANRSEILAKLKKETQISPRKIAAQNREARYFTGKPCCKGHIAERCTYDGACVICANAKSKKLSRVRYAKNKKVIKEKSKKYRELNKERINTLNRRYKKQNVSKIKANAANRRASKLQRTPKWVLAEELWLIKEIFDLATLRTKLHGFSWHVDHIIPLQGKLVSGLHTPFNLQVIPWVENITKGNRYEI